MPSRRWSPLLLLFALIPLALLVWGLGLVLGPTQGASPELPEDGTGTSAHSASAPPEAPLEEPQPSREPEPMQSAVRPPRSGDSVTFLHQGAPTRGHEEIRAELDELVVGTMMDRVRLQKLFEELALLGTEEAIGVLLQELENPTVQYLAKSGSLASLLIPLDDPRVYSAAVSGFDRLLQFGREGYSGARGYLEVFATRGGVEGARRLVGFLQAGEPPLSHMAANLVGRFADHSMLPDLVQMVREDAAHASQVVQGLAQWKHPDALREVMALTGDSERPERVRKVAARSLAQNMDADLLPGYATLFYEARSPEQRALIISQGQVVARNGRLTPSQLREHMVPVLQAALQDEDSRVHRAAVAQLFTVQFYRQPELIPALRTVQAREPSSAQRDRIQRLIDDIAKQQQDGDR